MAINPPIEKGISPLTGEDAELVEHALTQILASPNFKAAQQMQKFLKYVVRKTLAGQQLQLKQYTIAVEGLEMPTDFDSDNNPLIRIVAGRVRDRLKKYYKEQGTDHPLLISIPKGSYIPDFDKKSYVLPVLPHPKLHSDGPKLALACFSDKTQSDSSNRLLYQLTDNLAKELSHFIFSKLAVSIPHADNEFSNEVEKNMKPRYKADYSLILNLQELHNESPHLMCRLNDLNSEEVLWSDSYEINKKASLLEQQVICGKLISTIFDLQQGALHINWARKLLRNPAKIQKKHQVLAYYRYHADNFSRDSFKKAASACEEILDNNPEDLIANVVYADCCRQEYVYDYGVIKSPLGKGKVCAEKAACLKPSSHEAHYVLGQILFNMGEKELSLFEFDAARIISKYHTLVTFGIGYHYCAMNKWAKGMSLIKEAMDSNPTHPDWYHMIPFLADYRKENYKEALKSAQRIITPGIFWGPLGRTVCYSQLGQADKASIELEDLLKRFPGFIVRGKQILKRFLGQETLTSHVWNGLLKAGIKEHLK